MSGNNNEFTFWKLLEKYKVEIPIIQRDYAQGREFEKVEEIRNVFLDKIYEALTEEKHLDLDFIYGSLKEDKVFMPLDGQQRLTTLFLLHWYLAVKESKLNEASVNLIKFTYETRSSSREFCNSLVTDNSMFINLDFSAEEIISDKIIDSPWFFLSWEKDPTIKAMLVMLDAIHNKFKKSEELFNKLISDSDLPISFQFIELENFGLDDGLYIKMNSRGKALTNFENFKAKFQQLLQQREKDLELPYGFTKDFSEKMDGKWTDLFWNYRNSNNIFDNEIMNFIRSIVINQCALKENSEIEKVLNYLISKEHISFAKYVEFDCFTKDVIEEILNTLDHLENNGHKIKTYLPNKDVIDELELFEKMLTSPKENKITYTNRAMFFAITQYFFINRGNIDSNKFSEWIRVIRNLVVNTIDNNASEFSRTIKSIKELISSSSDILKFLTNEENNINRFSKDQIEEERVKAILILKGDKWKNIIIEAENHGYFEGQIGFIIKFSGILSAYKTDKQLNWSLELENKYYESFVKYFRKASLIFKHNGLNVNSELWSRALLSKGDYLINSGRNLSFLINSHRDISWKRLLRDDNKRDYVKELLDDIDDDRIEYSLMSIIDKSTVNDWRKYFIEIPGIINECGSNRFIRKEDDNNILLLNSSTTAGYCKEYYSYALYLDLIKNNNINYIETRGAWEYKYIKINKDDVTTFITYEFIEEPGINKWVYVVEEDKTKVYCNEQEEVKKYLRSKGYIS